MAEKKKFYNVEIPLLNESAELLAGEISELEGKTVKIDLTRRLRGKSTEIKFIVHVKDNKASAEPKKLELMKFFIRRMMKKGISYVEDSFATESKTDKIRIKPFMLTRKKVSRAVRNELRNKAKEFLTNYAKSRETDELFSDIINNKLQKELSLKLKKIYPLSLCEIRIFEIVKKNSGENSFQIEVEKVGEETEQTENASETTSENIEIDPFQEA